MGDVLLFIIGIFSFSFLEPLFFYAFGISLFLVLGYVLFNKKIKMFGMVFITFLAILLDITLKFPIGSHLLSIVSVLIVCFVCDRFLPENLPFFEFFKLLLSLFIGLILLKYLKSYSFSNLYISNAILPAFFSSIIAIVSRGLFSQFGSNNPLNKLKIK